MLVAKRPGELIRQKILKEFSLSVKAAADAMGMTRERLSAVVNGKVPLSPIMALRAEKAFGVPMEELLAIQTQVDIAKTRAADRLNVQRYHPTSKCG